MRVTFHTYEHYIIDYLEGNLDPVLKNDMEIFFRQHPDIKDEVNDLLVTSVKPGKEVFTRKHQLKRENIDYKSDQELFDKHCIAGYEGDLSKEEQKEFFAFLNTSPAKKKEYQFWSKITLQPDLGIKFSGKQKLKKPAFPKPIFLWSTAISAAAVALIFLWLNMVNRNVVDLDNKLTDNSKVQMQTIQHKSNTEKENSGNKSGNKSDEKNKLNKKDNQQKVPPGKIQNNKRTKPFLKNEDSQKQRQKKSREKNILMNHNEFLAMKFNTISPVARIPDFRKIPLRPSSSGSMTNRKHKNSAVNQKRAGLDDYLVTQLEKKIRENEVIEPKIKWWNIAHVCVHGINKLTGKEMELKNEYDERGKLLVFVLHTEHFEVRKPVHKKNR
jgi:hypothetical protein